MPCPKRPHRTCLCPSVSFQVARAAEDAQAATARYRHEADAAVAAAHAECAAARQVSEVQAAAVATLQARLEERAAELASTKAQAELIAQVAPLVLFDLLH